MQNVTTYRNKRNPNKFIQVKRYGCGAYYFRQFMKWGDVINFMGVASGAYRRNGLRNMRQVLEEDYEAI